MALRNVTAILLLAVQTTASAGAQVKQNFVDGLAAHDAGRGVPRDPARALAWLTLAAERGRLEDLSAAAKPERRAAAARLAGRLLDDGG